MDAAAGLPAPGNEEVSGLPVKLGQRKTTDSALRGRADLRHRAQTAPQTFRVDQDPNPFVAALKFTLQADVWYKFNINIVYR